MIANRAKAKLTCCDSVQWHPHGGEVVARGAVSFQSSLERSQNRSGSGGYSVCLTGFPAAHAS